MNDQKIHWHRGRFMIGERIGCWYTPNFHIIKNAGLYNPAATGFYHWGICFNFLQFWFVIGFKFEEK